MTALGGFRLLGNVRFHQGEKQAPVRAARRWVAHLLAERAPWAPADDVVMVVSELATNAVRYSRSGAVSGGLTVRVLASLDKALRVVVADDGGAATLPTLGDGNGSDDFECGRGLMVVDGLAEDWGYAVTGSDRFIVVWAEFHAPRSNGAGSSPLERAVGSRDSIAALRTGPDSAGGSSLALGAEAEAAKAARDFVGDWFVERGFAEEAADDARTIVSELVSNAYLHAVGVEDILLRLSACEKGALIEVWDGDGRRPVPGDLEDVGSEHGRGLAIVEALASAWGTRPLARGGKSVWALVGGA